MARVFCPRIPRQHRLSRKSVSLLGLWRLARKRLSGLPGRDVVFAKSRRGKRLRDPEYLRREAGCYFRAIDRSSKAVGPKSG
jgi:hypothetical protein